MKKNARTKLSLHRETLRSLDSEKMLEVHGGSAACSFACTQTSAGCGPNSNNCATGSALCQEH